MLRSNEYAFIIQSSNPVQFWIVLLCHEHFIHLYSQKNEKWNESLTIFGGNGNEN